PPTEATASGSSSVSGDAPLDVPAVAGGAGTVGAVVPKDKLKFGEWLKKKGKDGDGKVSNGAKVGIGVAAVAVTATAIGLGIANSKQKKKGAEKYGCPSGYKLKKKFMAKVANAKAWSCVGPCANSISASIDGQAVTLSGGKKKFLSKKCKFSFAGASAAVGAADAADSESDD
ncbi:MAG: hypothetical protein AAB425_13890, partial [Bdellovibrionota bacterium]